MKIKMCMKFRIGRDDTLVYKVGALCTEALAPGRCSKVKVMGKYRKDSGTRRSTRPIETCETPLIRVIWSYTGGSGALKILAGSLGHETELLDLCGRVRKVVYKYKGDHMRSKRHMMF